MLPGQTPDIASGALTISSWNPSRIYNFKLYHSYALRLPLWRQPEWSWPVHFLVLSIVVPKRLVLLGLAGRNGDGRASWLDRQHGARSAGSQQGLVVRE